MEPSPSIVSFALTTAVLAAVAGCRSGPATAEAPSEVATSKATPPCQEQRVATKVIVLEVERLDEPAARRVEAMLADKYSEGIISAVANPSTKLGTILASADSDITVASALDLVEALGFQTREGNEAAYEAAEADLCSWTLTIPVADAHVDGPLDGRGAYSTLQSLEASLDPLRNRFNQDRGRLRFIALLSPT
jgi:hypothetical protein